MRKGIDVLELLVVDFIITREHIVERVKNIAQLLYGNLVGGAVCFFGETVPETPDAALVVDCTRLKSAGQKSRSTKPKCFQREALCVWFEERGLC